jgi:hypothetical protein
MWFIKFLGDMAVVVSYSGFLLCVLKIASQGGGLSVKSLSDSYAWWSSVVIFAASFFCYFVEKFAAWPLGKRVDCIRKLYRIPVLSPLVMYFRVRNGDGIVPNTSNLIMSNSSGEELLQIKNGVAVKPWFLSRAFFLGLIPLLFSFWAWWDSNRAMSFATAWSPDGYLMAGQTKGAIVFVNAGALNPLNISQFSKARERDGEIQRESEVHYFGGWCFPRAFESSVVGEGSSLSRFSFLAWWMIVIMYAIVWILIIRWRQHLYGNGVRTRISTNGLPDDGGEG